jgi:hypothetical protein
MKVKVLTFCIAKLTERSLSSTALQVGRLQVRTTHGAAHTVAYDGLAPSHPVTDPECSQSPANHRWMTMIIRTFIYNMYSCGVNGDTKRKEFERWKKK